MSRRTKLSRSGAQRERHKQKAVTLVHAASPTQPDRATEDEREQSEQLEKTTTPAFPGSSDQSETTGHTRPHSSSASASIAARRRIYSRLNKPLMTDEDVAIIKRELLTISGLSIVMIAIIIIAYIILV